jgi:hypothetical protein
MRRKTLFIATNLVEKALLKHSSWNSIKLIAIIITADP